MRNKIIRKVQQRCNFPRCVAHVDNTYNSVVTVEKMIFFVNRNALRSKETRNKSIFPGRISKISLKIFETTSKLMPYATAPVSHPSTPGEEEPLSAFALGATKNLFTSSEIIVN